MPDSPTLIDVLRAHVAERPFDLVVTAIFFLAIVHTFLSARFTALASRVQRAHEARHGVVTPSVGAELLHVFGDVEVVFGLWAVPLILAMTIYQGWEATRHYLEDTITYTEAMFVVVIMAMASTRPVVVFAESALRRLAMIGRCTPAAWWCTILMVGPILGSVITEPAAMTISALLLSRQFYDLQPSDRLKYATLGLLFVNVSIGGTLTHFAAPPVLMVARPWDWDSGFMLSHFGWRAAIAIVSSTLLYFALFRREFTALSSRQPVPDIDTPDEGAAAPSRLLPVPLWITLVHAAFIVWAVVNGHYPVLLIGGFLFFLGFVRATASYQSWIDLRAPLLVGFFLGGLVIHGGLQGWWISPVLRSLGENALFAGSTFLTAFNDNALITYLGTLVPAMDERLKIALVEGAVTGGGLTVIANAPNPAGQALLGKFFDGAIRPWYLLLGATVPTVIAAAAFRLL
jgi:hypothetical protein